MTDLEYLHLSDLLMLLVLKFGILKYLRYVIYRYYKFWENGCGNVNYFVFVDQPMRCERPIADHGTGHALKLDAQRQYVVIGSLALLLILFCLFFSRLLI